MTTPCRLGTRSARTRRNGGIAAQELEGFRIAPSLKEMRKLRVKAVAMFGDDLIELGRPFDDRVAISNFDSSQERDKGFFNLGFHGS